MRKIKIKIKELLIRKRNDLMIFLNKIIEIINIKINL